jgi:hypothetical protein
MQMRAVRLYTGITVLVAHLLGIALFLVVGYEPLGGDFGEIFKGIAAIAPVSAVYVTAFLNYILNAPPGNDTALFPQSSFVVQYGLVVVFSIALLAIPGYILFSDHIPSDYAAVAAGGVDAIFGAYIALIFNRLFPT